MKLIQNSNRMPLFGFTILLAWCSSETIAGFQRTRGQQPIIARLTPEQLKALTGEVYPQGLLNKPVKWSVTIYSVKDGNIVYILTPPDDRVKFEYAPRKVLPSGKVELAGPEDF